MGEVLIVGGGHQGLAMAAHLAMNGETVNLWNRSESNIKDIIYTGHIECDGTVNGTAVINKASTDIDSLMSGLIMVTTPSSAHKDIAKMLATRVSKETIIVLNPGRTFGANEFVKALKEYGCKSLPMVAETQTIVYTCRRSENNSVTIFALKNDVSIAAYDSEKINIIVDSLPECLKSHFSPVDTTIKTSLGNVGMILHCAPVLMNIGWIESDVVQFKYYYDGISESVSNFLEKLDKERINVANAMGCKVETLVEWLQKTYKVEGKNIYECIHNNRFYRKIDAPDTIEHRYLDEDIPCGLVPLESAGKKYGIPTPMTTLIIDLACAVREKNYRENGRVI